MNTKQNTVLMRLLTWLVLPLAIIAVAYLLVDSIMQPVNFRNRPSEGCARAPGCVQERQRKIHR